MRYQNQQKQRHIKQVKMPKLSKSLTSKTQQISNGKPQISSHKMTQNTCKRVKSIITIWPSHDDLEKLQLIPTKMTKILPRAQLNDSKIQAPEKPQVLKQYRCEQIEEKKMYDNQKNCPNSEVQCQASAVEKQSHLVYLAQSLQQCQSDKVPEMIIEIQQSIQNVDKNNENAPDSIIEQYKQPEQDSHMIDESEAAFESFCLPSEHNKAEIQSLNIMMITEEKKEPQPKHNQNNYMSDRAQLPPSNLLEQSNHVSPRYPDSAQCNSYKGYKNGLSTKIISKSKPQKRSNSKRKDPKTTQTYHCHCNSRGCQDRYCGCHRQGMWCSQKCLCSLCTNIPNHKAHPKVMRSNPIAPLELFDGIEEDFEMEMSFGVVEFFNIQQQPSEPMVKPEGPIEVENCEDQKVAFNISEPNVVLNDPGQSICSGKNEIREILQEKHQLEYQYDNSLT